MNDTDARRSPSVVQPAEIVIDHVSKVYDSRRGPVEALRDIHFDVASAEFVSLLGPSGCGKSTLLMIVAGLLRPSGGVIVIDNTAVANPQTQVGIAFQEPVLLDWRTALDNVLLQVEARGLSRREYRDRALDLLRQVGLSGFEKMHPYELSGGMKQRVAICRALVHDPPLLLMDEPFGALDALTRDQMAIDLQRLWLQSPKTVVFVTHSIAEAVFLSDRIIVMSARPGTIDAIISIDMPRPRSVRDRGTQRFARYVSEILELFERQGVISES